MSNSNEKLVEVRHLKKYFKVSKGLLHAVDDVSFYINRGETLGLVGESGCGKSVLCKSIMKLLPSSARICSGSIRVKGVDITGYGEREMQRLRGKPYI